MITPEIASELHEWEVLACTPPLSWERQIIGKLVSEVRKLQHELDDPNYNYVGRIHRQAIICRNEQIASLEKQIIELKKGKT